MGFNKNIMFLYSQWLQLDLPARMKIAEDFGIEKKGSTEVVQNTIAKDGYLITDIEEKLNLDALQKFLHSTDTDMAILWDKLIKSYTHPSPKVEGTFDVDSVQPMPVEPVIETQPNPEPLPELPPLDETELKVLTEAVDKTPDAKEIKGKK